MYRSSASAFTIHRLSGTPGSNTGVVIDDRETTHQDALWDQGAGKLYIASHVFSTSPASGYPARLYRFSYNSAQTPTRSMVAFRPRPSTTGRSETLVIDKDSTGQLWATWTRSSKRLCQPDDRGATDSWGSEFIPTSSAAIPASARMTSRRSSRSGETRSACLWSKQNGSPDAFHFSIHQDNAADTTWGASTAVFPGNNNADDHLNLKADPAGNLYAVVKTSRTASGDPNLVVLRRAASNGAWTNATVQHPDGSSNPLHARRSRCRHDE